VGSGRRRQTHLADAPADCSRHPGHRMKIGVFTVDVPATVGGGYVLRDEVAQELLRHQGRHSIEFVSANSLVAKAGRSAVGRHLARLARLRRFVRASRGSAFEADLRRRNVDLLWFNHLEPIDVGLPYILNIFDLQHRLQSFFPEVSAGGLWEEREKAWAPAIMRAALVTVGSEEAKRDLCLFYGMPAGRVRVIEFPTPQRAIAGAQQAAKDPCAGQALRDKYGIKGEFLYYPAQFWAHKNHVNLLRALKISRERDGTELSLALTGSDQGNLAHVRRVAAELGLESHVHFLGFVPPDDVIALYRHAFALTFVSFFGPENLPPLEAMSLRCPVVLADIEGVRALFGEAPILVDPRDEGAIAAGIRFLRDKPEQREKRISLGREIALRNTRHDYVRKLCDLFDEFEAIRRAWPSGPWPPAS
jgi:glycosyltransferase involved in cell wall biosynthesis